MVDSSYLLKEFSEIEEMLLTKHPQLTKYQIRQAVYLKRQSKKPELLSDENIQWIFNRFIKQLDKEIQLYSINGSKKDEIFIMLDLNIIPNMIPKTDAEVDLIVASLRDNYVKDWLDEYKFNNGISKHCLRVLKVTSVTRGYVLVYFDVSKLFDEPIGLKNDTEGGEDIRKQIEGGSMDIS